MGYVLKSLLLVLLIFPMVNFFVVLVLAVARMRIEGAAFSLLITLLTGAYLGWRHAKKSNLPDSFALRYWPLVAPIMFILLAYNFLTNTSGSYTTLFYISGMLTAPSSFFHEFNKAIIIWSLSYVPLIISFAVSVPSEKKLINTNLSWLACALTIALPIALVWDPAWQVKQVHSNMLPTYFGGAMVGDEEIARSYYRPWSRPEHSRLPRLDTPASFLIHENFPRIDGPILFAPIFSAAANEIYQIDDKNELRRYIDMPSPWGGDEQFINRLIHGSVDLAIVHRPSDAQLTAAQNAGVELHLTPIAREAFVFFVNHRNPVSNLSIEQIQDIYLRNITNWRQVGGDNRRILPFQRNHGSASQATMINEVMGGRNLPMPPLVLNYVGSFSYMGILRVRDIAMYRDQEESIGYSFRFSTRGMLQFGEEDTLRWWTLRPAPYAEPVKLLSVNGVAPTVENIRNGSYPFIQYIYAVTAGTSNPHVPGLVEWLLSPQGQELIERVGYVGVR